MKFRKFRRQFCRMALSFLLCFCSLMPAFRQGVLAESIDEEMFGEVYFYYNASGGYVISDVWSVVRSRWRLGGRIAYCVNPNVMVAYDDVYAAEDFMSYEGLPLGTRQRLADIAHFGCTKDHNEALDYVAAQLMIWTAVNPNLASTQIFVQPGDSMVLVDGTDVTASVQEHINRIESDISRYHTHPDLEVYNVSSGEYLDPSAGVIETAIEDQIIITDRAGVLPCFQMISVPAGADVSQDGNSVSLCFHEAVQESELALRRQEADEGIYGGVILYRADGSQSIVSAGAASDTEHTSLKFRIRGVDLHITKSSSDCLMALKDARLGLYEDENENGLFDEGEPLVEEFVSGEEEHVIHDLIPGRHYVLHEISPPNGHVRADDIPFVPQRGDLGSGISCQMTDQAFKVIVRKNTQRNDRIADIELTVLDAETMEPARSSDGREAVWRTMADIDWDCSEYLQEGREYILRETELIGGVFKSADTRFTAPKAGDPALYVSVTMIDQTYQVHVRKVDNTEKASIVPEVMLTLYEKTEDGEKELASHITEEGEEYWDVTEYVRAERSYVLRETECAPGYYLSDDVEFTVPDSEKLQEEDYVYEIVMVDDIHNVVFGKKDEEGNWVEGAVIQILDERMEARRQEKEDEIMVKGMRPPRDYLYRFVSGSEGVKYDENGEEMKLYSGRTYYLHEEQAPFGYAPAAEDVPFTVTGTLDECQAITITNKRLNAYVSVFKYDSEDRKTPLKGAEFTVYRKKDGKTAKDAEGRDAVMKTDEKGQCLFVLPYDADGYEIRETAAPAGYLKSDEKAQFMIEDEKAFDPKTPLTFRFYDKKVPETSARAPLFTASVFCLALAVFVFLQKKHG